MSSNLFVDDLQSDVSGRRQQQLDAVVYVTASTQSTDFYWEDAGLRIHVGLDDVRLVPEYQDVDHSDDDDNDYTLNNPNERRDRERFEEVVSNFCRLVSKSSEEEVSTSYVCCLWWLSSIAKISNAAKCAAVHLS